MQRKPLVLAMVSAGFLVVSALVNTAVGQTSLNQGNALDNPLQQQGGGLPRALDGRIMPGGSGNALDANLAIGSSGVRDIRNYQGYRPDYQVGNLLVTGSIAGGKNFRGQVGYTAAADFRGEVGADEIFPALRGSGLSQIQFINSGLANDRYANARGMGYYEYRRDYTPALQIYNTSQAAEINQDRIRLDRTNAYTSSRNLYDTAVNASSLRLIMEESETGGETSMRSVEVSPIQGIYTWAIEPGTSYTGFSLFDRAALLSDARAGGTDMSQLGAAYETPTARIPPEQMLNGMIEATPDTLNRLDTRIEGNIFQEDQEDQMDAYERVVRELVERYGDDENVKLDVNPEVLARVRKELDEIRALTMGYEVESDFEFEEQLDPFDDSLTQPETKTEEPEESSESEEDSADRTETEEEKQVRLKEERAERLEQAAALLRNGGRVESFSEGQIGRIAQLMKSGEDLLRKGSFFNAEARFDQVLRINPGNPLALYGRANAQLGAGLYLSAALSMRKLYMSYPELIGTSISPSFLPSETRLRFTRLKLLERIQRGKDLSSYGLCLAYVGRLLDEPASISEGLSYMEGDPNDAVLADLIRRVWLEKKNAPEK